MSDEPHDVSRRTLLGALGTVAAAGELGTAGAATRPDRGDGGLASPAPGPDVLYDEPVPSPTLAPSDDWAAEPLLVSSSEAYVDGEYLYQGWVHDDYGAATPEETGTESPVETTLDEPEGDLVDPTDEDRYRHNAVDIVAVRIRPTDDGGAYRVAMNTSAEPDAAAVAVGINRGGATDTDWGHGLGDLGTAVDTVVVAAGDRTTVDGVGDVLSYDVDTERDHVELELSLDPGEETWTHYAVAGVHDGDGGFAQVRPRPTEAEPGGAVSDVPPVFDVAFRLDEDEPLLDPDTGFGVSWCEYAQARALADRDITALGADVDFGQLRSSADVRNLPDGSLADLPGRYLNWLFASRAEFGDETAYDEGVDPSSRPLLLGDVQPYSIYLPSSYDEADPDPAPLVVVPHSLGQNYNQYAQTVNMLRQLGEQRDAIVLMFEGRGPDGWWRDEAEFDLFEAWGDAAARYEIDLDRVTINGYSMGGYATYKLASQYPDLFGAGFSVVGPADEDIFGGPTNGEYSSDEESQNTMRITDDLRHVPLLVWAGTNDEPVPYPGVRNYRRRLAEHGYRHRLDSFPGVDHFALFRFDEWDPGAEFLGDAEATRRPARVTYRAVPEFDNERFGLVHDGAYWVQEVEVAPDVEDGLVDATSLAEGHDGPVADTCQTAGSEPLPHTREGVRWAEAADTVDRESGSGVAGGNAIEIDCGGAGAVTLYVDETGVDPARELTLDVETTHEVAVTLESRVGTETVTVSPGEDAVTVSIPGEGGRSPGGA